MDVSILAIATSVPSYCYTQSEIVDKMIDILSLDSQKAKDIQQLYKNSAIQTRYSVIADFKKDRSEWKFWGVNFPKTIPGTLQRNQIYKTEAPKLAYEAASKALKKWGEQPNAITHVISVSCTGIIAPGIEFDLLRLLQLNPSVQRLAINFMGCFGAFKGLAIAQSLAKEDPKNRVLLVCTELCSLHFQTELNADNLLANALFADGAAAVIVGAEPKFSENSLWTIYRKSSLALPETTEKMKWEVSDHGFIMKLSHTVPVLLGKHIRSFIQDLTPANFDYGCCDWAIHPGGKSIIQAIEKALKINQELTRASWHVLANYGNMSSATFLFVLDRLIEQKSLNTWTVGLGFGPGLSVEGIVLKKPEVEVK